MSKVNIKVGDVAATHLLIDNKPVVGTITKINDKTFNITTDEGIRLTNVALKELKRI